MYNTINPAVIKSILIRMKLKDLIVEMEFMRSQIEILEHGNKRNMFLRLYHFSKDREEKLIEYRNSFKRSPNV